MVNMNYSTEICGNNTGFAHCICAYDVVYWQKYKHKKNYTHNMNFDNKLYLFNSEKKWLLVEKQWHSHKVSVMLIKIFMEN